VFSSSFLLNSGTNYEATLNLPSTDFPMRANAVVREPQIRANILAGLCVTVARSTPFFMLECNDPAFATLGVGLYVLAGDMLEF
jgi:hypothetical protein